LKTSSGTHLLENINLSREIVDPPAASRLLDFCPDTKHQSQRRQTEQQQEQHKKNHTRRGRGNSRTVTNMDY